MNTSERVHKKQKEEWELLFPNAFQFGGMNNEWFIDLTVQKEPEHEKDILVEIVDEVFKEGGLHSRSYHAASVESCKRYKIYLDGKK